MPLRKNPQILTEPLFASIAPSVPLRLEPPENPAKATGHRTLWGHSFRIAASAAASMARRPWVESWRGLIAASAPSAIQPSAVAGARYHSASITLVRWKSLVEVTMRIGQVRAGSNDGGNVRRARPGSTL